MFTTILLLLLIYFIIWPLCKLLWRGYKFNQRWKEATAGMRDAYNRATSGASEHTQQQKAKKKKIDPSVGEYVSFEEVKVETTVDSQTTSDGKTKVRVESQIEDAVWEEIK